MIEWLAQVARAKVHTLQQRNEAQEPEMPARRPPIFGDGCMTSTDFRGIYAVAT